MIETMTGYTNMHLNYFTRYGLFLRYMAIAWIDISAILLHCNCYSSTNCNILRHITLSVNAVFNTMVSKNLKHLVQLSKIIDLLTLIFDICRLRCRW